MNNSVKVREVTVRYATATRWWKHGDHDSVLGLAEVAGYLGALEWLNRNRLKRHKKTIDGSTGFCGTAVVLPGDWIIDPEDDGVFAMSDWHFKRSGWRVIGEEKE